MLLTKIKIAATGLVLVALIAGIGTKFIPNQVQGGRPTILTGDQRRSETPKPVDPILNDRFADLWTAEDRERAPDDRRGVAPAVSGKVVAVARGGKAITVEVPPQGRGEEGKKVEIKLADNTQITYFGVGLGGAKLTEGYMAQVWTADGSKDVAVRLALVGMASVRPTPGLRGKVEKVSADGKVITLLAPATQRGQARAEGEVKEIKLTDKTTLVYSNIGMGGAKPTIGYMADVFLERGSKDAAFQINFRGEVDLPDRGRVQNRPEVAGKVVAVGGDQKTVAVEVPGGRGEEPTKREIKIGDKTTVAFMTVGPNGDKPQDGQRAMVWMAEGSKDTAARVVFVGTVKERNDTVMGQVVGVAADGKGITVQLQPMARGEDGKKVHVQFNDKTEIVFQAVGPDGAKPAEGHFVQVWLEEGSKDTAVRALFGQGGGRR